MRTAIRLPSFPPAAPDELRKSWRTILERFDRLDRAISAGRVRPEELESRLAALSAPEDDPAIQQAYGLGIHAPWVRSFEQYYARWAALMPDAPAQRGPDGRAVTLAEWVLMSEVTIAVQDKDGASLELLAKELQTKHPESWVTGWAKAEQDRFPPPTPFAQAYFAAQTSAFSP